MKGGVDMLYNLIQTAQWSVLSAIAKFRKSERGDTNFISIIIILGIVILVAGIFIGFKDKIVQEVQGIINGFSVAGGSSGGSAAP